MLARNSVEFDLWEFEVSLRLRLCVSGMGALSMLNNLRGPVGMGFAAPLFDSRAGGGETIRSLLPQDVLWQTSATAARSHCERQTGVQADCGRAPIDCLQWPGRHDSSKLSCWIGEGFSFWTGARFSGLQVGACHISCGLCAGSTASSLSMWRRRHGGQSQGTGGIRFSAFSGVPVTSGANLLPVRLPIIPTVIAGDSILESKTASSTDTPLVAQSKLIRKLSDANLCIRQMRRQLQAKDSAIVNHEGQLVALELELGALATLAQEVASAGVVSGTRKINGRYIQSHLSFKLEEIHSRLLSRIQEFQVLCDVELVWMGMAESVQVMGSFDGWTFGTEMSPEISGAFTRFSGTLRLPRGRYEIKFLVDGEWQLSPQLPSVGEGLACNNLLVVE